MAPFQRKSLPPSMHIALLLIVATAVWAYWPGLIGLLETWQSDPDYNHGFLVVPIAVWLLWQRRDRLASLDIRPSWWGLALIAAAGIVRSLGAEFFIEQLDPYSIPIWIAGVVLLFGGWQLLKWSAGSIAFLWFMTPIPTSMIVGVSLPLQKISAVISTWTLHLFAQPAVRQGTTISLGEQIMDVERACSGLRICYGILALAVAYVVLVRPKLLRGMLLIAAAVPVAILANSARVTGTGLLFLVVSGEKAHQYAHDFAGIMMLPLAVALLWLVHRTLEKVIAAFERSTMVGGMLLLKGGVAIAVLATGLVLWQRTQADAAVGTLLEIAKRYETDGARYQTEDKVQEAARAWSMAANFLDRYCRVRPDDAAAANRLAVAAERIAFRPAGMVRASRLYKQAWRLDPENNELGFKETRLALAGEDFPMAVAGAEKLLQQTDPAKPEHLQAFQLKVLAQIQDADRQDSDTTWTQVTETLKQGITDGIDPVSCSYQLAVIYRQRPVDSIEARQRTTAAEQVFAELLTNRAEDPLAWFARYTFHRIFPAPEVVPDAAPPANPDPVTDPVVEASGDPAADTNTVLADTMTQNADADLDRAIELATKNPAAETHPIWLAAGEREFANKRYDSGQPYFENAVKANPKHFRAYLQLARLATGLEGEVNPGTDVTPEQRKAAIGILKQGLSYDELKTELLLRVELVRQQLQSLDEEQVAEANQQIRELKSEFRKLPSELGVPLQLNLALVQSQIYADADNSAKASQLLESVLTSDEVKALPAGSGLLSGAWLTLGNYYERQGLTDQANACFKQATDLEPTSIQTAMYQAFSAERSNNISAAADLYEDVALRARNRPEPWLALARNELRQQLARGTSQRDFSRFAKAMAEAKAVDARLEETAVLDAEYLMAQGNMPEALKKLEDAALENPKSSDLWRSLAILRQANGDAAGTQVALTRYQETADNPLQATLVQADLLVRAQDWDKARQVLTEALQTTTDLTDQRQLHGQLVQIELLNDSADTAQQLLEQFARQHPEDIPAQMQLADFYWGRQKLDLMEQSEKNLEKLEGENGVFWKELRARRLIELARQTIDPKAAAPFLAEAKILVAALESLKINRPNTQVLLGRLALREQQFPEAATYFETAWKEGKTTVSLGTELVYALQASGNTARVEFYLEQMQNFLTASPQLYDLALGSRSRIVFGDPDRANQIASGWVESVGDADSYVRLARTLLLKKVQTELERSQQLQQVEVAYRKAIELDPKNPQSWGEFLRFVYRDLNDPPRMMLELNTFIQNSAASELDRNFAAAQLLSELGLLQPAARFWNTTLELALQSDENETRQRVLTLAAAFFARTDEVRASDLARQALAPNASDALRASDAANLRLLTALLSDANTASSLKEASSLLDSLKEASKPLTDPDKRIIASVLYRRAKLVPPEPTAANDLLEAAQLLNSVSQPSDADRVQQARIIAAQGDQRAALFALSEQARRTGASAAAIRAFVEYWQDNFAVKDELKDTLADRVQQALQTLETTAGAEIVSLDLRLRAPGLTSDEKYDTLRQFVTRIATTRSEAADQDVLLQQTFALLADKELREMSLRLLSEDLSPLTNAQKLTALVSVTILDPGSPEFEASLQTQVASQLPMLDDGAAERAAADYYFMRALWPEAEQYYRKCLQRDPNDVAATNNLALVVAEQRADFAEADRLIQQGLAIMVTTKAPAGSNSYLLDTQSQLLLAAGKTDAAYAILVPMSQSAAADASVFLHLAECLHQMNNDEESQKAFKVAQQLGITANLLPPMDKRIYDNLLTIYAVKKGVSNP